ncbi:MAG: alpha/beta hydrolase [Micavibrio sp.]|nr:alpha/beta hydrolase [Micavibrio sp.]
MSAQLPIVFIPGASSDATVWDAQKDYFAHRTDVIAVDLTQFDSIDAMSNEVLRLAPPEFIVCGTSMGGYVALDVLKKAKGRVKKAIFCNTSARADTPARARQRMMDVNAGEAAYLAGREEPDHYKVFVGEKSFRNADLLARLKAISLRVGYGCFKRHQTACSTRPDSLAFLPQIDMPVLLIGGAEDAVTPPELQAEMHDKIKGSLLTIIPAVGHIAHMEAAGLVTAEIEKFLATAAERKTA